MAWAFNETKERDLGEVLGGPRCSFLRPTSVQIGETKINLPKAYSGDIEVEFACQNDKPGRYILALEEYKGSTHLKYSSLDTSPALGVGEDCPICLQTIDIQLKGSQSPVRLECCKRVFHHGCVFTLMRSSHAKCPICRASIQGDSIRYWQNLPVARQYRTHTDEYCERTL